MIESKMEKLYSYNLAEFLCEHPEAAKDTEPDQWESLSGSDWALIAAEQLETMAPYLNKYNAWEKFYGEDWASLLWTNPEFSVELDKINGWEKLNDYDPAGYCNWSVVLMRNPQFFDKCVAAKGLDMISIWEWQKIFCMSPSLYEKVADRNILEHFNFYMWGELFDDLEYNNHADKTPFFEDLAKNYLNGTACLAARHPERAGEYKLIGEISAWGWACALEKNEKCLDLCAKHGGWEKIVKDKEVVEYINKYAPESVKTAMAQMGITA